MCEKHGSAWNVQFCMNEWKGVRVTQIPRIFGPCWQRGNHLLPPPPSLLTIDHTIHRRKYASTSRCTCFYLIYDGAYDRFRGNAPPIYPRESSGGSKGSRVSNYPSNLPSVFCINPWKTKCLFPSSSGTPSESFSPPVIR
jgi:hypothetical protein